MNVYKGESKLSKRHRFCSKHELSDCHCADCDPSSVFGKTWLDLARESEVTSVFLVKAYLCSLHYCLHNHHCCSFNCTVQGCMCLPDGKECKIGSACCSKICHKTDSKRKLGTCQQFGE